MQKKTNVIATLGPMIASEEEIFTLINKGVTDFWIDYGLKNADIYIRLLKNIMNKQQINLYLDFPSSRCCHLQSKGEIVVDHEYDLYDESDVINKDENYLTMRGLRAVLPNLEIGEKIYYNDKLYIFGIREIDEKNNRLVVSCEKMNDSTSVDSNTSNWISFDGMDKKYDILRNIDREILLRLKKKNILPDYIALSFCKDQNDVVSTRREIQGIFGKDIKILVKLQNRSSVNHIDEIITCSEGIVIDREDLVYAIEAYRLPEIQQIIIKKAKEKKKKSILCGSYMSEFSKTLNVNTAEQSDVYRVKEEGGDFILLTKETSYASHAIATVEEIYRIIRGDIR